MSSLTDQRIEEEVKKAENEKAMHKRIRETLEKGGDYAFDCPNCARPLSKAEAKMANCPYCEQPYMKDD